MNTALFSGTQATMATLVVICFASLLVMMLIARIGRYNAFTRSMMDLLMALSIGTGLIVVLMAMFA